MVMGGGTRGTIEQLEPEMRERIRQSNLEYLRRNQVNSLAVDVLYAVSTSTKIFIHLRVNLI
jgi:hypothetical protein